MSLVPWNETVTDDLGNVIPEPVVTVRVNDGSTFPLADIYDASGDALSNPITGGLDGFVQFWVKPGAYQIVGNKGGSESQPNYWDAVDLTVTQPYANRAAAVAAWAARASDVTKISWYSAQLPSTDAVVLSVVYSDGATAISDMADAVPDGDAFAYHWAENTTPGTTDMTAAIQACLAAGYVVNIRGNNAFSQRLDSDVDYAGIRGRNRDIDYLQCLASGFNSTLAAAAKGTNNVLIDASGTDGPVFENFGIRWHSTPGYHLKYGIIVDACDSPVVKGLSFTGIPTGKMVAGSTCTGRPVARDIIATDCQNPTVFADGTGVLTQCTVVEVDEDTVGVAWDIQNITGINMGNTGAALAAWGTQADVVNVKKGVGHHIFNVWGKNVGEVVDCFAHHCTGGNFFGEDCEGSTLKLIHGAQYNVFNNVQGINNEYQAVSISEGNGGYLSTATAYNLVTGVVSVGIDPNDSKGATYTTACVRFDGGGAGVGCFGNRVEAVHLDPGTYGEWAVFAEVDAEDNVCIVQTMEAGVSGRVAGPVLVPRSETNANGTFVIDEQGFMTCFYEMDISAEAVTTADGSLFRTGEITWTYPKAYPSGSEPIVNANWQRGADISGGANVRGNFATTARLVAWAATSIPAANAKSLMLHAYGPAL